MSETSVTASTTANGAATSGSNEGMLNLNNPYAALEDKLRTALREVYDPELGMSVIELGLIRKIDWAPSEVDVTMILTTPFCPYGPAMIDSVRQKTQEATEYTARVTLGLEQWEPTMMEDQAAANWGLYY